MATVLFILQGNSQEHMFNVQRFWRKEVSGHDQVYPLARHLEAQRAQRLRTLASSQWAEMKQ